MREITCFCGKSKKSFKNHKIENFFDICCEQAGFDFMGNKVVVEEPKKEELVVEKPEPVEPIVKEIKDVPKKPKKKNKKKVKKED